MSLQFTSALVADVLFRAGEPVDGNSEFEATALAYLNRAYFGLALGGGEFLPGMHEQWSWLFKRPPGILTLVPGTLEYPLAADVLRVLSPMRVFRGTEPRMLQEVYGTDPDALWRETWLSPHGVPSRFALVADQVVRFDAVGPDVATDLMRIEYSYLFRPTPLTLPGVTEEPFVPWAWRRVLADWALFFLLIDKNDDRAEAAGAAARSSLNAMASEHRHKLSTTNPRFGGIEPRQSGWRWR